MDKLYTVVFITELSLFIYVYSKAQSEVKHVILTEPNVCFNIYFGNCLLKNHGGPVGEGLRCRS